MAKIIFTSVTYANFRSIGNSPISIKLSDHKTTLLSGVSGAGKSSFIHAICFGLFGRGYGTINKPALMNSINQKRLLVTVEFSIGKKNYKIVRGMKPNIFEIWEDNKLRNQDPTIKDYQSILEKQILKFNYRAFTQVVAISGGSDYIPFMRLGAKERREFVEDLLDIRIFSTMNQLVKEDYKSSKEEVKDFDRTLKSLKEKIVLQESFVKKLQREKEISSDKILQAISVLQDRNSALQKSVDATIDNLSYHKGRVENHEKLDGKLSEIKNEIRSLKNQLSISNQNRDSFLKIDQCPSCKQNVSERHKNMIVQEIDLLTYDISCDISTVVKHEVDIIESMSEYESSLSEYSKIQKELNELNSSIYGNNVTIKNANQQLSDMQQDSSSIAQESDKLKDFAKEYLTTDKQKKSVLESQQYQEFIQQILSDSGIKSKIIKQYIPTINKLINSNLTDLDMYVSLVLDEQFNESFKSRHRDTFSYDNFSDGQKRRIDLAITLAWISIAKAKNALNTNLLILDEADNSLDSACADLFLQSIKKCTSDNIFIISHKNDQLTEKVDHTIQFRLHKNFTEIVPSI